MSACKECKGRGWVLFNNIDTGFILIRRCDECQRFPNDAAAARHIERQFEDKEPMPGMSACKSCLGTGVLWKKPFQAAFVRCANCNKFADDEHFLKAIQALLQAQGTPAAPPAETLLRKLLSRFMDFDGGPHWTEADCDLAEKCWAHFRNADRGETETPKPTPLPSSPLKFGSLKEMGEHIFKMCVAHEKGEQLQYWRGSNFGWVEEDIPIRYVLVEPERCRLKPAPAKPREWWAIYDRAGDVVQVTDAKAQTEHASVKECGFTLKRLIEWPEGAELPDLPA